MSPSTNLNFGVLSNPAVIGLGIGTTLLEIRSTFKSLNKIGRFYTSGPIFKIAAYELSEFGIFGAELAFNRDNCLDALYFQFEKVHHPYLLEHLRKVFTLGNEHDCIQDNFMAVFSNGPIEITLDPQKPGSACFLSYASQAFKQARNSVMHNDSLLPYTFWSL